MNVGTSTRRKALLLIFRLYRKRRGGTLSQTELERNWARTGLRKEDLKLALNDMTQAHLLNVRRSAAGVAWELSYMGERAMNLAMEHPVNALRDWLTLGRARIRRGQRPRSGAPFDPRRATDSS